VVYAVVGRRLYMAVDSDGWKARQIANGQEVAVTVPVRPGGILSLLMPIPPTSIAFRAAATVHPAGSLDVRSLSHDLAKLVPEGREESSVIIELAPKGRLVAYGIGVSLMDMRDPAQARVGCPSRREVELTPGRDGCIVIARRGNRRAASTDGR
jgi:hypothetical protein